MNALFAQDDGLVADVQDVSRHVDINHKRASLAFVAHQAFVH
jgi:hypothetical protein